jgi:hypothetical protein
MFLREIKRLRFKVELEYPFIMIKHDSNTKTHEVQGSITIGDDVILIL